MKSQVDLEPETSHVLSRARGLQESVRDKAQQVTRATSRYVEDNPWKAIAIVAVCTLALGFLLKPSSD